LIRAHVLLYYFILFEKVLTPVALEIFIGFATWSCCAPFADCSRNIAFYSPAAYLVALRFRVAAFLARALGSPQRARLHSEVSLARRALRADTVPVAKDGQGDLLLSGRTR
jgi:hypothetical protein